MAEEAEPKDNAKNNTKKIIAIAVSAVVVVAAAVTAVILINKGNNNSGQQSEVLNDDFFKTDDKKIVISTVSNSSDPNVAEKVHQVYTVDGNKITGLKVYSKFSTEQAAKDADAKPEVEEGLKAGNYKDHKVEGTFVIVTMADSSYQAVTAEELRATAAALEKVMNGGSDSQQTQTETKTETKTEETQTQTEASAQPEAEAQTQQTEEASSEQ